MASTNKTVNYELSQFEGTDKPSWEADYNADMLAIDTNLKAVSDVANGASGDITTLEGRMTTAEGNISTNANDIDALEGRADALEAGQTSDDSRLDALEAEQIVQNTAIESNTRLGYNLARPYDSASTYAVNSYVLFQDTLYKCTTAISTGEAFDPNKWLAIKATDEIAGAGSFNHISYTGNIFKAKADGQHRAFLWPLSGGSSTQISLPVYNFQGCGVDIWSNSDIAIVTFKARCNINATDTGSRDTKFANMLIEIELDPTYQYYNEINTFISSISEKTEITNTDNAVDQSIIRRCKLNSTNTVFSLENNGIVFSTNNAGNVYLSLVEGYSTYIVKLS